MRIQLPLQFIEVALGENDSHIHPLTDV